MEKSTSITNLSKALVTFHVKVSKVSKDAMNPFFKSKYASLSNILEAINEPLIESGLCFSQFPTDENGLTTILMHSESGEFLQSTYVMKPVKDDPQGRGSVITYQRRYALAAVLGLNIDEDDDANTATHGGATPDKAVKAADDNKPWLNKTNKDKSITDTWNKAVDALANGIVTIEQITGKYKVSKENMAELKQILNHQPA